MKTSPVVPSTPMVIFTWWGEPTRGILSGSIRWRSNFNRQPLASRHCRRTHLKRNRNQTHKKTRWAAHLPVPRRVFPANGTRQSHSPSQKCRELREGVCRWQRHTSRHHTHPSNSRSQRCRDIPQAVRHRASHTDSAANGTRRRHSLNQKYNRPQGANHRRKLASQDPGPMRCEKS